MKGRHAGVRNKITERRSLSFGAGALAALILAIVAALAGPITASTTAAAPSMAMLPAITGTAVQGATLVASSGSWTGDAPISFAYQWRDCDADGASCTDVAGATGQTHLVTAAELGKTIRIRVTATNAIGAGAALSPATAVVVTGSAPANTGQPDVTGTLQLGQTLTAGTGGWSGTPPITFTFAWQRCDAALRCSDIAGATGRTYVATAADVAHRLRARVTAKNALGAGSVFTNLTDRAIAATGAKPAMTTAPIVAGRAQEGFTLTTSTGTWSSQTAVRFAYVWLRCDSRGNGCATVPGTSASSYLLGSADVGHTVRSQITATNSSGGTSGASPPTAVVTGAATGLIRLPDGTYSVPAEKVSLPQRLIISSVAFSPSRLTSRNPFTARFRVTDTRGYAVRDALVYVIGLPYGLVESAPEARTDSAGYATITLQPTRRLSLRRGALVMFVRARTQSDDLLAGVSTRRLVQVRVNR